MLFFVFHTVLSATSRSPPFSTSFRPLGFFLCTTLFWTFYCCYFCWYKSIILLMIKPKLALPLHEDICFMFHFCVCFSFRVTIPWPGWWSPSWLWETTSLGQSMHQAHEPDKKELHTIACNLLNHSQNNIPIKTVETLISIKILH